MNVLNPAIHIPPTANGFNIQAVDGQATPVITDLVAMNLIADPEYGAAGLTISIDPNHLPAFGTATASSQSISYTPGSGTSGSSISFNYIACDANSLCATAQVNVNVVTGLTAFPINVTVVSGGSITQYVSGAQGGSMLLCNTPTTTNCFPQLVTSLGSAQVSYNGITYTNSGGVGTSDSFSYYIVSNGMTSNTAAFTVSITPPLLTGTNGTSTATSNLTPVLAQSQLDVQLSPLEKLYVNITSNLVPNASTGLVPNIITFVTNIGSTNIQATSYGNQISIAGSIPGTWSIYYDACNKQSSVCAHGIINANVLQPPILVNGQIVLLSIETSQNINFNQFITNDGDVIPPDMYVQINTYPTQGTLSSPTASFPNMNMAMNYTPNFGYRGLDHLQYSVCSQEKHMCSAPASMDIRMNSKPILGNNTIFLPLSHNAPNTINIDLLGARNLEDNPIVVLNRIDPLSQENAILIEYYASQNMTLPAVISSAGGDPFSPSNGFVSCLHNCSYTFAQGSTATSDSFGLRAFDGYEYSDPVANITIINDTPPVINNSPPLRIVTNEDTASRPLNETINDQDGNKIYLMVVTLPTKGQIALPGTMNIDLSMNTNFGSGTSPIPLLFFKSRYKWS